MSDTVLAIDAGTTNVTALVIASDGRVLGKATNPYKLLYPGTGLVEQDPEELWSTTMAAVTQSLNDAGLNASDISGIGITGQRATLIIWERDTGRALGPAINWQDLRGAQRAKELNEQGFIFVNQITQASKMEMALDFQPDSREKMRRGDLAWGNVDSFRACRLSDGTVHATDYSFACTTGYFDFLTEWKWIPKLLELQDLDPSMFPEVVDTSGEIGLTSRKVFGAEVPIGAIIGDQQSAVYAQGGLNPGLGKVTYGTSATTDVNTGSEIKLTAGTYPLVLWRRGETTAFCLEGMVITAGAVFKWLVELGVMKSLADAADMAASVSDPNGVFFLPALQGLGTPYSLPERRGAFEGLTLGATAPHLVRAAIEGVAFRVREMQDRLYKESGLTRPEVLRVDGRAAENDVLMQIQANVLGCPVERMKPLDATAFGTALLAGEGCGVWEPWTTFGLRQVDRVFEPQWKEDEREERFTTWRQVWRLDEI
ncbi:MAG: glycerol kinase [Deltaproteobacteria bacterium]|nr:glycerol kinase [Deltaproteobacteria bacterium]